MGRVSLAALLVLSGCAGEMSPRSDGPVSVEGGPQFPDGAPPDTAQATEGSGPVEASVTDGAAPGSCLAMVLCARPCTTLACVTTCLGQACSSAASLAQQLYTCGLTQCSSTCLSGYSTACETCLASQCSSAYSACLAHKSCAPAPG